MTEFLPLCDVLFNVISLAGYFCDVVFDVVLGYALLERGRIGYFITVISVVLVSLIVSQTVSFGWYWTSTKHKNTFNMETSIDCTETKNTAMPKHDSIKTIQYKTCAVIAIHMLQCGVLWRYAKLFVPVNLRRVKHEVRDLCVLRLVHGFCEAAPMLLLQLYLLITIQGDDKFLSEGSELRLKALSGKTYSTGIILTKSSSSAHQQAEKTFKDLNLISASLSLFSVCWALASFSKNVRLQNVHRLVLTWLGVIFQFIWRLGTVSSRIASLTVYASVYKYWVFLVITLHWFSMLLWIISPKNLFHGERISKIRKALLSSMIAFIYIFAYINLQEVNHRQKMFIFYTVMFLENVLLVCLWLAGTWEHKGSQWQLTALLILGTFFIGIFFMLVYYRFFHVRRLNWESGGRYNHQDDPIKNREQRKGDYINNNANNQHVIAGVFNCRFTNPVGSSATKRKKKKPTTFIPPPNLRYNSQVRNENSVNTIKGHIAMPFWRRTLSNSQGGSSENEGSSAGSRVNIHQKLQEKKQKQLAELKIIEEEIKQGKLGGPSTNTFNSGDDGRTSLPRQPIPRAKKHTNFLESLEWCSINGRVLQKNLQEIEELNKMNKYCNEDLYSLGLNSIDILEHQNISLKQVTLSVPPQASLTENNSISRHTAQSRNKIPHNRHHVFENYRSHPIRHNTATDKFEYSNMNNAFLEMNNPRQVPFSNNQIDSTQVSTNNGLPFPYNALPPPRTKIDSRSTPPTPPILIPQHDEKQSPPVTASELLLKFSQRHFQRSKTPEVLLAPHYLDKSRVYCDWVAKQQNYRSCHNNEHISSGDENLDGSVADDSVLGINEAMGHRASSDIDSQVSLPRSYTLPREFKYYRRNKPRKIIKHENFIASTNSSDGDVDSGDENDSDQTTNSDDSQCKAVPRLNMLIKGSNYHSHNGHNQSRILMSGMETPPNQYVQQSLTDQQTEANNSKSSSQLNVNLPIHLNNVDLISGVADNGQTNQVFNRTRIRTYALPKSTVSYLPYYRHETKL